MNDKELTQRQLEGTIDSLKALEELTELWYEMDQDFNGVDLEQDVTLAQRDLIRDYLEDNPDNAQENPLDIYLNDCLEIRELGHRSLGGDWESDGVKLLLTFGGPNTWLTIDHGNDWALLEVFWGDSARERVYVPQLAQFLTELTEQF